MEKSYIAGMVCGDSLMKNKAMARLATRGNSWILHDASFTKSWYLQGFVKT